MDIIPIILFAVSTNIDNLILGASLGIKNIYLDLISNFIISGVTFIFTFLSMYFANFIFGFIDQKKGSFLGNVILIIIGIYYIIKYFSNRDGDFAYHSYKEKSVKVSYLDIKRSFLIAFTLSINNFGLGIGASISGLSLYTASIFSLIFGALFLNVANLLARNFVSNLLGKYGELISGIVITILGIYQFIL